MYSLAAANVSVFESGVTSCSSRYPLTAFPSIVPGPYCPRARHRPHPGVRRRHDRGQHLVLLVADVVGGRRDRRLHRDQGQEVDHVVLDHVAQRTGVIVISAALLDAERLRRRDLDVLHVVPVPDRLEDRVGEAQREDVLHRLLAEVMVDAVDLVLGEDRLDGASAACAPTRDRFRTASPRLSGSSPRRSYRARRVSDV